MHTLFLSSSNSESKSRSNITNTVFTAGNRASSASAYSSKFSRKTITSSNNSTIYSRNRIQNTQPTIFARVFVTFICCLCLSDNRNSSKNNRGSSISSLEHSFNEMLGRPTDAEASAATSSSELIESPQPIRDLLIECAEAVSDRQWQRSIHFITLLLQRVSSSSSTTTALEGDAMERVIAQFVDSLASRVASSMGDSHSQTLLMQQLINQRQSVRGFPAWRSRPSLEEVQGAYLCFNQVTPFMRFTHLTATQAILEALEGGAWDSIHILDMEIMQGVQWPPLLQALQQRFGAGGLTPARVRISGVGKNAALLEQTGNHLTTFARSLGLQSFEFKPILATGIEDLTLHMQSMIQDGIHFNNSNGEDLYREALVVNATSFLMQLPISSSISSAFLSTLKSLHPVIVTLVDRESNYDSASVGERFGQAFLHYSALFESLEATLPPSSSERIRVENLWLRSQILGLCNTEDRVAEVSNLIDGPCPKWRDLLRAHGFNPISHSDFAKSQAKLLLRLHYPSEGYRVQEYGDCLLLGWRGTPLFAVSAWN